MATTPPRGCGPQSPDALGHVSSYAYDGDRRLTVVTDPQGNKTTYTYDANG